jgi:hypothetical protein
MCRVRPLNAASCTFVASDPGGRALPPQAISVAPNESLNQYPDVTAIFASSSRAALGALKALRKRGLVAPRDVSVVGLLMPRVGKRVCAQNIADRGSLQPKRSRQNRRTGWSGPWGSLRSCSQSVSGRLVPQSVGANRGVVSSKRCPRDFPGLVKPGQERLGLPASVAPGGAG